MNGEIIGSAVVIIIIILVLREVTCWYLKTSRIVEVLVEIKELLAEQNVLAATANLPPLVPENPKPKVYANRTNPSAGE